MPAMIRFTPEYEDAVKECAEMIRWKQKNGSLNDLAKKNGVHPHTLKTHAKELIQREELLAKQVRRQQKPA